MSTETLGIRELLDALAATPDGRPNRVFDQIARTLNIKDQAIATEVGCTRAWVQQKRSGKVAMKLEDIAKFSAALDVPPELFVGSPAEALEWLLEHRSEHFRCTAA